MRYHEIAGATGAAASMAVMTASIKNRVAAQQQARRTSGGPNTPSDPATFSAPHVIEMSIDIDDRIDDLRRIEAEHWCLDNAKHRWFRRTDKRHGTVSFAFEQEHDAIMFRLTN